MKKAAALVLLVLATSVISIVSFDYFQSGGPDNEGILQLMIRSDILKQDRELLIHLPRHFDSTKSYPVVYVLDGSSQDGPIAEKFDVLSSAGYAPSAIVVGIPNMTGENRQLQLVPPFMRTDVEKADSPFGEGDKFLAFMETELFPFMAKRYPASQTRLFMGSSRGGLLVMYSLLYKPEMFQARFCYSAPIWRQDNILVSKTAEFLRSGNSLPSFLFMSAGEKETTNMKGGLDSMAVLFKKLAPRGFVWHSEYTPNADHGDNSLISAAVAIAKWGEYVKE